MQKILYLFLISFLFSQAEITNIQASQRTDGSQIVDITYDLLEDAIFEEFTIIVEVSFDAGESFITINEATGDIGLNIVSGLDKLIIWEFGEQFNDIYSNEVQYKITATSDAIIVIEEDGCGAVPDGEIPFEMVVVEPGEFTFGENNELIELDCNYEIMKFEVTDYEYVTFLLSILDNEEVTVNLQGVWGPYIGDAVTSPTGPGENVKYIDFFQSKISWNGEILELLEGFVNHPVTGVSYYGAVMFADYYGMELPTEYEWEKAARGDTGYDYPWGNSIGIENANYQPTTDQLTTLPVGSFNGELLDTSIDVPGNTTPNLVYIESGAVYYNAYVPVSGFEFEFNGDFNDAYGGAAEDAGFMISTGNNTVIGFNLSGASFDNNPQVPLLFIDCNNCYLTEAQIHTDSGTAYPTTIDGTDNFILDIMISTNDSPSHFGAYDMGGNLAEWVQYELTDSNQRMIKGGSFKDNANELQSWRNSIISSNIDNNPNANSIGFRCIRRLPQN